MLTLLSLAQHNGFNGKPIAKDLREHIELWKGILVAQTANCNNCQPSLDCLWNQADLKFGYDADALYILVEDGKAKELTQLAKLWEPSEMRWMAAKEVSQVAEVELKDCAKKVLWIWWD